LIKDIKKIKSIIFKKRFFFLAGISFLLIVFFVGNLFSDKNNNIEEIKDYSHEKTLYPQRKSDDIKSPEIDVAGAISLYYDKSGEKILYEKNADESLPIASISKLMTALIVFENYNLEKPMLVTENDIITRTEFRDFRAWRETSVEEMIYPMIIESNNSAAFALALIGNRFFDIEEGVDSVDYFVKKMNEKAREIGLENTNFINPSGLDGRGEYNLSTAREVAIFAKHIIKEKEIIFEISKIPSYSLYSPDRFAQYKIINTNTFLHENKDGWKEKIIGGKTGWTYAAYGCLLMVIKSPERNGYVINVVLGAEDRFKEMEKLTDYVFENYIF